MKILPAICALCLLVGHLPAAPITWGPATNTSGAGNFVAGTRVYGLTFQSDENFLCDIQQSTTLEPGSWQTIRWFVPGSPTVNETTQAIPAPPTGPRTFLRVLRH